MTLFGINIRIDEKHLRTNNLQEELVSEFVKRNNERKIFSEFLYPIFDEISKAAKEEADLEVKNGRFVESSILEDYTQEKLTRIKNGNGNLYDSLIKKIILELDSHALDIDPLKNPKYPGLHKQASGLLHAKIKDGLNKNTKLEYLTEQKTRETVKNLSKEMFYALNKLGLKDDQTVRYLRVVYELGNIEIADAIKKPEFKSILADAIKNKSTLNLCHIKCLRFVYPKTGGVQLLTNTEDVVIDGVLGKYSPKSERLLFPRLLNIKRIFESSSICVNFSIILADEDLDLLFPESTKYLTSKQREKAIENLEIYLKYLQNNFGQEFKFYNIKTLINQHEHKYKKFRKQVLDDIARSGGEFVNPDFFEKDRVDHQYNYYQQLFGPSYSRSEARRSISEQTASTIALQEIFNIFDHPILLEENRGGENKLIANGSVPVIFVKLRDDAVKLAKFHLFNSSACF